MLRFITTTNDSLITYVKDDPVRPELSIEFRVAHNRFIAALVEDHQPTSMVCISLHDFIPASVEDLERTVEVPTVCVPYSIWSYSSGNGRNLLMNLIPEVIIKYPSITRIVTLSPKTNLARKFHLKNGAFILQENETSVNYEYPNVLRS